MIDVISTKETARLAAKLKQIRERGVAYDAGLMNQVAAIAADVRARGDAALVDYARSSTIIYSRSPTYELMSARCEHSQLRPTARWWPRCVKQSNGCGNFTNTSTRNRG
jgi:histidinol dehydrogenase